MQEHFAEHVTFGGRSIRSSGRRLWESETSGGLLLCIAPDAVAGYLAACAAEGQQAWQVGAIEAGTGVTVR